MQEITNESFLQSVCNHQMTVIKDDGVNRHLRFKAPGTIHMSFDVITWQGGLCYTGDMGSYVFQRLPDMFDFFRGSGPNTGYWGEKCVAVDSCDGIREYSPDKAREVIEEWVASTIDSVECNAEFAAGLRAAVNDELLPKIHDGEQAIRGAADEFYYADGDTTYWFKDFWEVTLTRKTSRFVWCCHALPWAIGVYDRSKLEQNI